jgi:hypothetical protein
MAPGVLLFVPRRQQHRTQAAQTRQQPEGRRMIDHGGRPQHALQVS